MAQSDLEKAFETLTEVFSMTEAEISEEVKVIEQQIEELKDRIVELHAKQDTLNHDKASISEMLSRYGTANGANRPDA